jgi:hypothetical protein
MEETEEHPKFPKNVSGLIDESRVDKQEYQRTWDVSLMFLSGNQWLTFDQTLKQFEVIRPRRVGRTRAQVNLLLNIYRNVLSRLSTTYPSVVVMPASPSQEDIVKAKSSEVALQYWWQQDGIKFKIEKAIEHLLTCGTAAYHTYYDPSKKSVTMDVISPYDLFFEAKVTGPELSDWVAIRTYHTKKELKEAYPQFSSQIDEAPFAGDDPGMKVRTHPKDRVAIYEMYWRDGKHAVTLGNTYLFKEEGLPTDLFPVQVIRYTEIPAQLWGLSLLVPLVDLQFYFNKYRTQVMRNVELMANPKWLIPKSAGVSDNAINDQPGEKVLYNIAGGKPEMMQPVPIPSYVLDNISRIQSEMMDVAGIHSVTLGKRAIGITSGKAIDQLAGQDLSQLEITQQSIEKATQEMAKVALGLMANFYTEGKMVSMLDKMGRVVWNQIKTTDLSTNPEVFIQAGSLFRHEAQDRDAKIMQLLEAGLIDPKSALKELSYRTGNSFVIEKVAGLAIAKDLLDGVMGGDNAEIYTSDDLVSIQEVIKSTMQTEEFYNLPQERQDYISDMLVSIDEFQNPDPQFRQAGIRRKVFPRTPVQNTQPGASIGNIAAMSSPEAAGQAAIEQQNMQALNQAQGMVDQKASVAPAEAIKSAAPGQGGLG